MAGTLRGATLAALFLLCCGISPAQDNPTAREARWALEKAVEFFTGLSARGGYLWWYSEDLRERAGENKATETQIWVQPPGTPSVGLAFLSAFRATRDRRHLAAARAAADALAWGQLESGGWDYLIDFDEQGSRRWYRRLERGSLSPAEMAGRNNNSTFDDDNSQSALRFLMAVDEASGGTALRQAIDHGLQGLLRAQYPNGAFPQRYDGKPREPSRHPVRRAQIPESYERTFPNRNYRSFYTLNDHTLRDCILTLLEAHRRYGKTEYLAAARRGGDFLLLAQLPAPQQSWAQQYDFAMEPAWARRFEPPSVCSNESAGAVRTLIDLYLETGEEKYLAPIPAAVDWFRRSQLAPDLWARFYELGTNRPLYFTKDYRLVYDDRDVPTHYSFKGSYGIPEAIAYYQEVRRSGRTAYLERWKAAPYLPEQKEARRRSLEPRVRELIRLLDDKGRWVVDGRLETRVFIRNVQLLSDYLELQN